MNLWSTWPRFLFFVFVFIQQWNCSNRIDWIWCLGHFKVVGMATPQLKFQFLTVASWNEIINLQRGFAHKTDAVTGVGCLFIYLFQILFIYWFVLGVDFGFTSLVGGCMQIKISIDLHKVTTFIWPVFNRNPRQFFFIAKINWMLIFSRMNSRSDLRSLGPQWRVPLTFHWRQFYLIGCNESVEQRLTFFRCCSPLPPTIFRIMQQLQQGEKEHDDDDDDDDDDDGRRRGSDWENHSPKLATCCVATKK